MRVGRTRTTTTARAIAGAALLLCIAAPSEACRTDYAPWSFEADTALLLGVATGEHVSVPPGNVVYYDRSRFVPEENDVPVRGYVVQVQAFHHPQSTGLSVVFEASGSRAILVPWGHRGDCKTARWDETVGRWVSSPEPAVYAAHLRAVAAPDGTPIFDVYSAYFEPYPTAKLLRDRIREVIRGGGRFLTAQEFFIFAASLPWRDEETEAITDVTRIRRWEQEHPDLAKRWPAVEALAALRKQGAL